MKAPIGAVVAITYDADPGVFLQAGEYLRTDKGRSYRIVDRYPVHGKYPNRWAISAMVIDAVPLHCGRRIHRLCFYRRDRKPGRGASS